MRAWLTALLLLLVAWAGASNFEILDYEVDGVLRPTGHVGVTERITVHFNVPQRGIFRTIPFAYARPQGGTRNLVISDVRVQGGPMHLSTKAGNLVIRIGDPDVVLPAGTEMTYVIAYELYGAINRIPQNGAWEPSAELYWTAIGTDWPTAIPLAKVTLRFKARS